MSDSLLAHESLRVARTSFPMQGHRAIMVIWLVPVLMLLLSGCSRENTKEPESIQQTTSNDSLDAFRKRGRFQFITFGPAGREQLFKVDTGNGKAWALSQSGSATNGAEYSWIRVKDSEPTPNPPDELSFRESKKERRRSDR